METIKNFIESISKRIVVIAIICLIIIGIGWYYTNNVNYDDSSTVRDEIKSAESTVDTVQGEVSESLDTVRDARSTASDIADTNRELQDEGRRTAEGISKLGESIQSTEGTVDSMGDSISRIDQLQSDKSELIDSATKSNNEASVTAGNIRKELTDGQSELDQLTTTDGEIRELLQQLRESSKEDRT